MAGKSFLRRTTAMRYKRDTSPKLELISSTGSHAVKRSLLYRASQVKERPSNIIDFSPPPEQQSTKQHGERDLDVKDTQEIQAQIDAISHKNRITLSAQELKIVPLKNGLVFPLVVDGVILGIAVAVLIFIVQLVREEQSQGTYTRAFVSVEGQLIQQLRQDSEVQLSVKEQEIEAIRKQLAAVKEEEQKEANRVAEEYRLREREFRSLLEKDIASERLRLVNQGIAEENLDALLVIYEQERFAYYRSELEKYQVQIESERQAAQASYQQLQDQYQQNLKQLNAERRIIQDELRQSETQLRIGSEQSMGSTLGPDRNAALEEAQSKLAVLQEQQRQALLRDNQIIGMYYEIRTSLEAERYRDALTQAESLGRYLEATPETGLSLERRSLDKYLAGALARIARTELTASRDSSPQIMDLEAQIALLKGDNERLTQVYQELSQTLAAQGPTREAEISERDAQIARLTQVNQELSLALSDQNRQKDGQIQELEARITRLSEDNERLTQANQELSQALTAQGNNQQQELGTRIASLEQDNERLTRTNQELSQALTAAADSRQGDLRELEARIASVEQDNERLTRTNQELSQARVDQSKVLAELEAENRRLNQSVAEQTKALTAAAETAVLSDNYMAITNAYARYAATPGRIPDTERFLNTPVVQDSFPGFLDRITAINRQTSLEGYQTGIGSAASIIETALRIGQHDTRTKYLEGMYERYKEDPAISGLIKLLIARLAN
ncbi:MAG: hypothetical protein LBQ30_04985 [Treponema sp.]|jgi:hypothetical protein|nr:hypothetical protein [Treponema sp.]